MPDNRKIPFCQRPEFSYSLITMFFLAFTAAVFAFLPVMGAHRLGVAVGDELSGAREPAPARIEAPKPEPVREPLEGIPVAYQSARTGP